MDSPQLTFIKLLSITVTANLLMPAVTGKSVPARPVIYWTLLPGLHHSGPYTKTVSLEESKAAVENFVKTTKMSNKVNLGVDVAAPAILNAFSAKVGLGFDWAYDKTSSKTENMEKRWESSISQSISVPAGQYYLVAVEMAMYPFIKEGEKRSLIQPTGALWEGLMDKQTLENMILDKTFDTLGKRFGIRTFYEDELRDMVDAKHVPVISSKYPKPNVFYKISNLNYPSDSISANKPGYGARGAGCGPKGYLTDGGDEWRFVKELNSPYYLIYNRKESNDRLGVFNLSAGLRKKVVVEEPLGLVPGGIDDSQKFEIEKLGNMRIRLRNKKSGKYLVQESYFNPKEKNHYKRLWHCGYVKAPANKGDDVWILQEGISVHF